MIEIIWDFKGDVAQECRQTQRLLAPPTPLLIKDIYSALRKIRC